MSRQRSRKELCAIFAKLGTVRVTKKGSTVKLAKPGEFRTVVPKEGVYLHVKKSKRGVMEADILRRTKERARRTSKPLSEPI